MDSNPGLQAHLQAGLQAHPTSTSKQIFLEPVDINLTDLNSLSSGVPREYLGGRIFFIYKKESRTDSFKNYRHDFFTAKESTHSFG